MDTRQHFQTVFTKLNLTLSVDEFIEYWLAHDSNVNIKNLPILGLMSGQKRYIAINQNRYRTKFLHQKFNTYCDGIFSSYDIGAMKPEPAFYNYIKTHLNIEPGDIAFIDDSKSHIDAAAKLGWVRHHYQKLEDFKRFIQKI